MSPRQPAGAKRQPPRKPAGVSSQAHGKVNHFGEPDPNGWTPSSEPVMLVDPGTERAQRALDGPHVRPALRFRGYAIVSRAVEEGVRFGLMAAHKHTDDPTEEQLQDALEREVTNALCEVIDFDGGEV